ncbi:calcium-binding protein [Bauldia litoralis]|uniref:calcium-binding protein n=2 Tax=Bauldia litoralis TaxID=665467 RepID=UPI00326330ED
MADITFTSSLAVNPGLEDVLDPAGVLDAVDATTFRIVNDTGGPWDGFVFEFTGSGFTYDGGNEPTVGTITGATLYQADGTTVVATITGSIGTSSLSNIWSVLAADGSVDALDDLLANVDTYTGGASSDHITVFGNGAGDTVFGGGGDDVITARRNSTLVGDGGSDTFHITGNGEYTIAGSAEDGSGGGGETNTVVFQTFSQILAITDIAAVEFSGTNSKSVYLAVDDVGEGLLSETLSVKGSSAGTDELRFVEANSAAVTLDLSGWTFSDWGRTDQRVLITTSNEVFADDVVGSSGSDYIFTYDGDDVLSGGAGVDYLYGGLGADILRGGAGNDFLYADADDTVIDGGADTDLLSLDLSTLTQAITIDSKLGTGILADTTVIFVGIEGLSSFTGGAGNDVIEAGEGNGTIYGGDGADTIDGEAGSDSLYGGGGNDELFSRLGDGPASGYQEALDGGAGTDFAFVNRSDKTRSLTLDLADSTVATSLGDGTTIVNIERIEFRSGSGNDNLTGGDLGDIILGNGGRDLISGRAGNDTLAGGDGLDIIDGGNGNDDIDGGDGIDFLSGDAGNDALDGGAGADLMDGGAGNDTLNGGSNGDNLGGGSGNDILNGNGGADIVDGGAGNDTIQGGSGRDTIDGEGGNDIINGGRGRDSLTGGDGADIFVFDEAAKKSNRDSIEDFVVKVDTIQLDNAIFTKLKAGALKKKTFEVGSEADDRKDRIIYDKDTGDLYYDKNGSKSGGMTKIADLDEGLKLTASDFFVI